MKEAESKNYTGHIRRASDLIHAKLNNVMLTYEKRLNAVSPDAPSVKIEAEEVAATPSVASETESTLPQKCSLENLIEDKPLLHPQRKPRLSFERPNKLYVNSHHVKRRTFTTENR